MQHLGPFSFELPKNGRVLLSIQRGSDDKVVVQIENLAVTDTLLPTSNAASNSTSREEDSSKIQAEEPAKEPKKEAKSQNSREQQEAQVSGTDETQNQVDGAQ